MTDIFEIVGIQAEVKLTLKGKVRSFPIHDPKYLDKVRLMKEMRDLSKLRGVMDDIELTEKDWHIQKKYVRLYLPELTESNIEDMGESAFRVLFQTVTDLAAERFNACVRKIDTEKKTLATTPV